MSKRLVLILRNFTFHDISQALIVAARADADEYLVGDLLVRLLCVVSALARRHLRRDDRLRVADLLSEEAATLRQTTFYIIPTAKRRMFPWRRSA
jgi:23S rRNA A2030 N6-methylase RlmJ